jgi:hypothetical protein
MSGFLDWLDNFFHPKGLGDNELTKQLNDLMAQSDREGEELKRKLEALVQSQVLGTEIDLSEILGEIESLRESLDELQAPPIDPDDFKTKVMRGDVAIGKLYDFRVEDLKEFVKDKVAEIKVIWQANFSKATLTTMMQNFGKLDWQKSVGTFVNRIKALVDIAIELKSVFFLVDTKMVELSQEKLSQSKPRQNVLEQRKKRI